MRRPKPSQYMSSSPQESFEGYSRRFLLASVIVSEGEVFLPKFAPFHLLSLMSHSESPMCRFLSLW